METCYRGVPLTRRRVFVVPSAPRLACPYQPYLVPQPCACASGLNLVSFKYSHSCQISVGGFVISPFSFLVANCVSPRLTRYVYIILQHITPANNKLIILQYAYSSQYCPLSRLWCDSSTNDAWQLLVTNAEHHTDGPSDKTHKQYTEACKDPELRTNILLLTRRTPPIRRLILLKTSNASARKALCATSSLSRSVLAETLAVPGAVVCGRRAGLEGGVAECRELAERLGDLLIALVCGSRGAEGLVFDLLGCAVWHGVGTEGVGWGRGLLEGVGIDEEGGTYVWNSVEVLLNDWLL